MWLSVSEASAATGINGATISGYIARKLIPSKTEYGVRLVRLEDVKNVRVEKQVPTSGIHRISYSPVRKTYRIDIKRKTRSVFFFETKDFEEAKAVLERFYQDNPEYRM